MSQELDNLDKQVMRNFAQFMRPYGMKDSHARIMGLIYVEPDELTMEKITEKTGYSLATVSNSMQILKRTGMVEKRKKPGSKKKYFYMEKDIIKLDQKKIESFQQNYIQAAEELPQVIEKYEKKAKTKRQEKKLEVIKNYHQQLIQMADLLEEIKQKLKQAETNYMENA